MDYVANNPELWNRQLDSGAELPKDDAFDNWLNGYLAEVLPAQESEHNAPAQMPLLPEVPSQRFPWEEGASPIQGYDIGSSTSGDAIQEQAHVEAQPNHEYEPDDSKAANRAARVADKNRRAQKRFREREKQRKATLETQVAELSARLSEVSQEKARLESRNSVLEKVVKLKEEYISNLENRPHNDDEDGRPPMNRSLHAALCKFYTVVKRKPSKFEAAGEPIPMSTIHTTHKAYIDELAQALMEGADDPSTPAHARMVQLINANRDVQGQLAVLSDRLYKAIRADQVIPGESPAKRPDVTHWRTVLGAVGLTEQQKEAVLAARHDLLTRMTSVLEERQCLVNSLQVVQHTMPGGELEQYPKQIERQRALEMLQKNLKEEYRAVVDYEVAFFNTILTPLQQARMQVAAYPWPTDSLAICSIVAEETGQTGQLTQPGQDDFMALLTGLSDRSPFRALATPMPVG